MGPNRIVMPAPFLDHDLGLPEGVKHLAVEKFVAQAGIEARRAYLSDVAANL